MLGLLLLWIVGLGIAGFSAGAIAACPLNPQQFLVGESLSAVQAAPLLTAALTAPAITFSTAVTGFFVADPNHSFACFSPSPDNVFLTVFDQSSPR